MKEFHAAVRRKGALLALTALTGGIIAPAAIAQQQPAAQGLTNSATARPGGAPATRYEDAVSQRSFVLQRQGNSALMKFDDSPEVMALRANTAQRGDDFLRSDSGQVMLRVTEQGNIITYFTNKGGAPADMAGMAQGFNAPPMPASLTSSQKDTASKLSRLAGHDVTVFGAGDFSAQAAWAADAMMVLTVGVERAKEISPKSVGELVAVRLQRGQAPSVSYSWEGELVLGVNPEAGYAGRPSSDAIAQAMINRKR